MNQYKEYKNRSGELSCILFGSKSIPLDPDNTDYQAYLKWVAEGNQPEPAENT
jgi:hypothetical protein